MRVSVPETFMIACGDTNWIGRKVCEDPQSIVPQNNLDARQRPTIPITTMGWGSSRKMNPNRKEGNKSINSTRQRLDAPIPFLITPQSRCLRKSIGVEHRCAGRNQDGNSQTVFSSCTWKVKKESQTIVIPHGSHKTRPDKDTREFKGGQNHR